MIHLAGPLAILLAALSQTGASEADAPAPAQDLVTREWTWTEAGGTTVLTVQGPADQVAQYEPGDPTSECPDCLLMSSVAYGEVAASADPAGPTPAIASEDR